MERKKHLNPVSVHTCMWNPWFISVFTQTVHCARNQCCGASPQTPRKQTHLALAWQRGKVLTSTTFHKLKRAINAGKERNRQQAALILRLWGRNPLHKMLIYTFNTGDYPPDQPLPPPTVLSTLAHLFPFVTSLRWSRLLCLIQTALNLLNPLHFPQKTDETVPADFYHRGPFR